MESEKPVMDANKIRYAHLAIAEAVDAWRVIPRLLLAAYGYLVLKIVDWYFALEPYVLEGCYSETVTDCIINNPTTGQTALVTAVVGLAPAVIGLYQASGRKWSDSGVKKWPFGSND